MPGWNEAFSIVTVFFVIILLGGLVGKIKLFNISLGLSATLIVSIIAGFLLNKYVPFVIDVDFQKNLSFLSKLGTAIFVSIIGLISGMSFNKRKSKISIISFIIGAIMVIAGFLLNYFILLLDSNMNKSLMMGIFCGALTSTPALSMVCESPEMAAEFAILGYGIAYLFGVINVVMFVQLITKQEKTEQVNYIKSTFGSADVLIIIAIVSILGNVLGMITFPFLNFSLGSTGGILIVGALIGVLLRKIFAKISEIKNSLNVYRDLGLVMFFVGNGIVAGQRLNAVIQIKWFVYGMVITTISVMFGCLMLQVFDKYFDNNSKALVVSGGMTSTPALGALLRKINSNSSIEYYSMAYLGALLTIMILIKLYI